MIRQIEIQNFKSVQELKLDLGRFNVLIGENGCGKSNILEAIAFASAAASGRLEHEFLSTRGIRISEPELMKASFNGDRQEFIRLSIGSESGQYSSVINENKENGPYSWSNSTNIVGAAMNLYDIPTVSGSISSLSEDEKRKFKKLFEELGLFHEEFTKELRLFLIYSPENTALRTFQGEAQILPLGIKGEGLFAHLKALSAPKFSERLKEISDRLDLIDWFAGFDVPEDLAPGERRLRIRDRYLVEQQIFDQRSANEGFLFLLFYFTLFISPDTPAFFAIDNVDASLNPKLCSELIRELVKLAEKYDKQVILTTHNPAILDGLNLHDDEQRLMVVYRNSEGHTKVRRVKAPQPVEGEPPVRLSEAFLRGYIGGLPKNF